MIFLLELGKESSLAYEGSRLAMTARQVQKETYVYTVVTNPNVKER
jgi:hypothetical protein